MTEVDDRLNSPRAIFSYAEAFAEATEKLQAQFRRQPSGTQAHVADAAHIAPTVTLDSFATELYLKCLYAIDHGMPSRGHKYQELFAALKPGMQQAVRYVYNDFLANHSVAEFMRRNEPTFIAGLDECLRISNETFESMRYLYEGGHGQQFYWPLLRLALRKTILSINPNWAT